MTDRLNQKSPELPVPQVAVTPATLVERLRIEAVLTQRMKSLFPFQNHILLSYPGFITCLWVEPRANGVFQVSLRSALGKVLLGEEARRLVAAGALPTGSQRLTIDEENHVLLEWSAQYAGRVEAVAVADALDEHARVAMQLQRALDEDCYLEPVEDPTGLIPKGRPR